MFSTMFFGIVINIIFSVSLIYSGHLFWEYLKDNYGKKHTKDLVNSQIQKYKRIVEELQENRSLGSQSIVSISDIERQNMNSELTEFLNSQLSTVSDAHPDSE